MLVNIQVDPSAHVLIASGEGNQWVSVITVSPGQRIGVWLGLNDGHAAWAIVRKITYDGKNMLFALDVTGFLEVPMRIIFPTGIPLPSPLPPIDVRKTPLGAARRSGVVRFGWRRRKRPYARRAVQSYRIIWQSS